MYHWLNNAHEVGIETILGKSNFGARASYVVLEDTQMFSLGMSFGTENKDSQYSISDFDEKWSGVLTLGASYSSLYGTGLRLSKLEMYSSFFNTSYLSLMILMVLWVL